MIVFYTQQSHLKFFMGRNENRYKQTRGQDYSIPNPPYHHPIFD